jgi:hypothetical protein
LNRGGVREDGIVNAGGDDVRIEMLGHFRIVFEDREITEGA